MRERQEIESRATLDGVSLESKAAAGVEALVVWFLSRRWFK